LNCLSGSSVLEVCDYLVRNKVGDVSELGFLVRFRSDTSRCPQ
jgi:hypothetical protein